MLLNRSFYFERAIQTISHTEMVVAFDNYSYEKKAFQQWLQEADESPTSPMTREPCEDKSVIPNLTLMSIISVFELNHSATVKINNIRKLLNCPITGNLMLEPMIASDGYTYDRSAIELWHQSFDNNALIKSFQTNQAIKSVIHILNSPSILSSKSELEIKETFKIRKLLFNNPEKLLTQSIYNVNELFINVLNMPTQLICAYQQEIRRQEIIKKQHTRIALLKKDIYETFIENSQPRVQNMAVDSPEFKQALDLDMKGIAYLLYFAANAAMLLGIILATAKDDNSLGVFIMQYASIPLTIGLILLLSKAWLYKNSVDHQTFNDAQNTISSAKLSSQQILVNLETILQKLSH